MISNSKKYLAEFIATFALVLIGAGAILSNDLSGGSSGLVGIALAHGFVIMVMVYATAHISGAHINPAVTIAFWITKKIKFSTSIGYIISQLLGASAAAYLLKNIYTSAPTELHLGLTQLADSINPMTGFIIEAVLTFFLVFTIFATAVDQRAPKGFYGLAIGSVLFFDILMGGPLTGAAMNPARAFGPALVSGYWTNYLIYWIGPIVGAIVAALIYNNFLLKENK
jgi:MIP family channel proteins